MRPLRRVIYLADHLENPETGGQIYHSEIASYLRLHSGSFFYVDMEGYVAGGALRANLRCLFRILQLGRGTIVTDSYYYARLCLCLRLVKLLGYRVAILVQTVPPGADQERQRQPVRKAMMRLLLSAADVLVANSSYMATVLHQQYGVSARKVVVIRPVGQRWKNVSATRPGSHSSRKVIILNVANIRPQKGQRELLQALALLRDRGCLAATHFVGTVKDPAYQEELHALMAELGVADTVTFSGFLGRDALSQAYREATLYAHPSLGESLGLAIQEAQWWGLPVIACDVGGIPELVDHGLDGWLVDPGDPIALADALWRLITDADLRTRIAEKGRRRAAMQPTWDDVGDRFHRALLVPEEQMKPS